MPEAFIQHMKKLLGRDYPAFETAMKEQPSRGVRVAGWNDDKAAGNARAIPDNLRDKLGDKIPWTSSGYYIDERLQLGKTVYHEAGALYLQEPSAMAIASLVEPQPGERILDLCAAPGGKTSALASLMGSSGQLVANEIHRDRVRILAENMERMGAHVAITNDTPDALAQAWPEEFDAILVDAPCSGEGMFRKNPEAADAWYSDAPKDCAIRQQDILRCALTMLRPGGRLIYSTCTFNEYENEQIVAWLADEFKMHIDEVTTLPAWSEGLSHVIDGADFIHRTKRLWPQLARGEGHYAARLIKPLESPRAMDPPETKRKKSGPSTPKPVALWDAWLDTYGIEPFDTWRHPVVHKGMLFANTIQSLARPGIHVLRPGTPLASLERDRITPSLGLARCLTDTHHHLFTEVDEDGAIQYFRGDAIPYDGEKRGFVVPAFQGLPLGFAKAVPGRLNNLYPKGLRKSNLVPIHEA